MPRNRDADAAKAASEAGRVLQAQRTQGEPAEFVEPVPREEGSRPTLRNEPRRLAMEEIVQRDLASKGIQDEPEPKAEEKPEDKPIEAKPVEPAPAKPEDKPAAEPAEEEKPKLETIRVKVDGEEFDAPKADVEEAGGIRPYQMLKASEKRLKEAKDASLQTRQAQTALMEFLQRQQPAKEAEKPVAEFIKEQLEKFRYGTADDSAAALQAILERSTQKVDPSAITAHVMGMVAQQNAESSFVTEFQDVVQNPLLLKLIINMKDERIDAAAKGGQRINDWSGFYRAIGNEVRTAIGKPHQQAQAQTEGNTSQSDKEARKASITNLPTAAARATKPEADKPETREDILREMRKSRGLPTA